MSRPWPVTLGPPEADAGAPAAAIRPTAARTALAVLLALLTTDLTPRADPLEGHLR